MKTITRSQRFYYSELHQDMYAAVRHDLMTYASMLHRAYRILYEVYFHQKDRPKNLSKQLKEYYHTSDYMPLSAIHEAKAILKSTIECNKREQKNVKQRIKRIKNKMKNNESKICKLDTRIHDFVRRSKVEQLSESEYLEEVQICKPKRKRIMNQQKMLLFRLHKEEYHLIGLQKRVKQTCFGGRKIMRSRTTYSNHEEWLNEYRKARTSRMEIPRKKTGEVWKQSIQI